MPSIVYQSPGMSSRRLSLVSQSVQEQINGLVNVAVQYVTTAANRERVAAFFYVDAPPPIWPDSVNQFELQNRALYMVSRSISQANGLVTIDVEYAGGLRRGGSPPLLITTERDGPNNYSFVLESQSVTVTNYPDAPASYTNVNSQTLTYTPSESLSWMSTIYEYQFVDIDGLRPELPPLGSLYSIIAYFKTSYTTRWVDGRNEIFNQSISSDDPERYPNSPFQLPYFEGQLNGKPVIVDEKPSFITPTVKLITVRKYIE
jgi:hypothetical protein